MLETDVSDNHLFYVPFPAVSISLPPFVLQKVNRSLKSFALHPEDGRQQAARGLLSNWAKGTNLIFYRKVAVRMLSFLRQVQDGSCHANY
jgi:hypothetical protein